MTERPITARRPSPRLRAVAALLPVALFALLSPRALEIISQTKAEFLGLPLKAFYIFGLWLLAIVIGALIARALRQHSQTSEGQEPQP